MSIFDVLEPGEVTRKFSIWLFPIDPSTGKRVEFNREQEAILMATELGRIRLQAVNELIQMPGFHLTDTSKNVVEAERNLLKIIPLDARPCYVIRLSNTVTGFAVLTIINDIHIGFTKSFFAHYRFEYFKGRFYFEGPNGRYKFRSIDDFLTSISLRKVKPFPFPKMNYEWSYSVKPWIEGCVGCNHPKPLLMDPITENPFCGTSCYELYKNIIN
jgi:hypothetical protein